MREESGKDVGCFAGSSEFTRLHCRAAQESECLAEATDHTPVVTDPPRYPF